jgi:hypothetical protein
MRVVASGKVDIQIKLRNCARRQGQRLTLFDKVKAGDVDLQDPATTLALLKLNAAWIGGILPTPPVLHPSHHPPLTAPPDAVTAIPAGRTSASLPQGCRGSCIIVNGNRVQEDCPFLPGGRSQRRHLLAAEDHGRSVSDAPGAELRSVEWRSNL